MLKADQPLDPGLACCLVAHVEIHDVLVRAFDGGVKVAPRLGLLIDGLLSQFLVGLYVGHPANAVPCQVCDGCAARDAAPLGVGHCEYCG